MQTVRHTFHEVITGAYVILGALFYLGWCATLILPLSEGYGEDYVLRLLILGTLSALLCLLGCIGFVLVYRKSPVEDLALLHVLHPVFGLGVWMTDERYRWIPISLFSIGYLWLFILVALRVRAYNAE